MTRMLWLAAVLCSCNATPPVAPSAPASAPPAAAPSPGAPATPGDAAAGRGFDQIFGAPAAGGAIGTAHPVTLERIADDGSWMVVCQARKDTDGDGKIEVGYGMHGRTFGDQLAPYLIVGAGPGAALDAYVGQSGDGAWLAVIRGGVLELIEPGKRRLTPLPDADVRDDGYPYGNARAAAIADQGTRMTYVRHAADRDRIVIRELATGHERAVDIDGTAWRMAIDDGGRWAQVSVLPAGAAWPVAQTSLAPRGCRGPVGSYTSGGLRGDPPVLRWLDLERGAFVAEAALPAGVKDGFETGGHHRGTRSTRRAGEPDAAEIWCSEDDACSDAAGKKIKLPAGKVEYAFGDRILIRAAGKPIVFNATTRTSTALAATGETTDANGQAVTIGDGLYDLLTAKRIGASRDTVVGHAGARILLGHAQGACTPKPGDMPYACVDGVANPAAGGFQGLPSGPLRWAN